MYRKEVNDRSPLRVFERSIHGGLGRGNVGAVVAPRGVGKTAFLVQIALDDLMRDRQVLHITYDHEVRRLRSFYDQLFHELALTTQLRQPQQMRLDIERRRLLYSLLDTPAVAGDDPFAKLVATVDFARRLAQFEPHTVLVDGFDFNACDASIFAAFRQLASRLQCELWISSTMAPQATTPAPGNPVEGRAALEPPLRHGFEDMAVIVQLHARGRDVDLQLLKDHENEDLTTLQLRLDGNSMQMASGGLAPQRKRTAQPNCYHLFSGGARGAEATFGACAERYGVQETHFSFEGHPFRSRERGAVMLSEAELARGDFSLLYVAHRLERSLSKIPNIKRILQTTWHQISASDEVFVIGSLQSNGSVRGGTGWGAELARLWGKPICLFDQENGHWLRWDTTRWRIEDKPRIERLTFAGIGTTKLTPEGRAAIEALFANSFDLA